MRRTITMTADFFAAQQLGDTVGLERYLRARSVDPAAWFVSWVDVPGGKILILDANCVGGVAPIDHAPDEAPPHLIANQDGVLVLNPARVPDALSVEELYPPDVHPPTSVEYTPSGLRPVDLAQPLEDAAQAVGAGE